MYVLARVAPARVEAGVDAAGPPRPSSSGGGHEAPTADLSFMISLWASESGDSGHSLFVKTYMHCILLAFETPEESPR